MILIMLSVFLLNAVILLTFIIWIPRLLYSLELSTKSNKIRPSVDNNSRYYLTIKYVVQLWLNNQEGNAYIIGLCLNLLVTPILESQFNFTATVLVASASKYPFYISRQCWCDFVFIVGLWSEQRHLAIPGFNVMIILFFVIDDGSE